MCFWFITQTDYIQVFLRTLADVSVHDIFLLHSSSSSLIYYAAGGVLRPSRSSASSNKIRRWIGKRKTPVRNARNYHLCLSRLKNFVEILGVQVFALMQKMLLSEHLWCEFSIFCIVFSKVLYTIESQKFWTETDTENLLMKKLLSESFSLHSHHHR